MKKGIILFTFMLIAADLCGYIGPQVDFIKKQASAGLQVRASNTDLRGADLSGLQAPNGIFAGTKAQPCEPNSDGTTLGICVANQSTSFKNANLKGANFNDSTLREVDFSDADLTNATFYRADLSGANFTNATVTGVRFTDDQDIVRVYNGNLEDGASPITASDITDQDRQDYQITSLCGLQRDGKTCDDDTMTDSQGNTFKCNCTVPDDTSDSE